LEKKPISIDELEQVVGGALMYQDEELDMNMTLEAFNEQYGDINFQKKLEDSFTGVNWNSIKGMTLQAVSDFYGETVLQELISGSGLVNQPHHHHHHH